MTTADNSPTATILSEPAAVIHFALDHLEPFEVCEFLKEWRDGRDLTPWVEAAMQDKEASPNADGGRTA